MTASSYLATRMPGAKSVLRNYALIALLLAASWLFAAGPTNALIESALLKHGSNGPMLLIFIEMSIVAVFGFLAYELAKPTIIPSFVLAIFVGMLQHQNLNALVSDSQTLTILTTLGAIFILFGGGLDTPFTRFRKLIGPILSIAFLGTIVTAFLFSVGLTSVSNAMSISIPLSATILVGAALASTDPAAIIPSFKCLTFKQPRVKYIAISESALNDVIGAVLTGAFLSVIANHPDTTSLVQTYGKLLTAETGLEILFEIIIGVAVGVGGFLVLQIWNRWKAGHEASGEADAALFLAVPLICFTGAVAMGGNGFLAVFVSSLMFNLEERMQHVEHYFNHTIEGFMKPLIFMLLGAAVNVDDLLQVTSIGVAMGLLFIFVIRPIVVFFTLSPFMTGKHRFTLQELFFLSFVRETGVIPAVLLIGLKVSGIPGAETVVAIGLWVILLTLIIQPPLTPLVAKMLKIASRTGALAASVHHEPIAVLCSRGNSYERRLQDVANWAQVHGLSHVSLLHCPEDKFTPAVVKSTRKRAETIFNDMNERFKEQGQKQLVFEFISREGSLQDNIESLVSQSDVSIIFVGKGMLDYRMDDVKRIPVPFVFLT